MIVKSKISRLELVAEYGADFPDRSAIYSIIDSLIKYGGVIRVQLENFVVDLNK